MGGDRRSTSRYGAATGNASRSHAKWASDSCSPYTLFRNSLHDAIIDAYLQSNISRQEGLTRDQLVAVAEKPVSEHFHSYLCCSICYENALICAVGTCTHVLCFLCMMRLKNFYDDCNVYECSYCKQESDVLVVCANPFFAHLCVDSTLYTHNGTAELSSWGLETLLRILGVDTSDDRSLLSRDIVNVKEFHHIFIESAKKMSARAMKSFNTNMQQLLHKTQQLSIEKPEQREPFHHVYNVRHPRPRVQGGMVFVGAHRMLFESPSIYLLFRAVGTAVCWAPDCKSLWNSSSLSTMEDIDKAVEVLAKSRYGSYMSLSKHLKSKHGLVICDICHRHFCFKRFICEMPLYRLQDIKNHVKQGDPDEVPPIPAHVICSGCNRLQWDLAELKSHAKMDHFFCNLCDSEGSSCEIYTDYDTLFSHFRTYHYPCEEQDCMFVVFPDDIQLQLHYMSKHPHRQRPSTPRKPKVPPRVAGDQVPGTKPTKHICPLPSNCLPWDGNIRIIREAEPPREDHVSLPEKAPVSKEFEEWLRKHPYLTDPQLSGIDKSQELFDVYVKSLINLNLDSTVKEFDYDTFNVKCAVRVMNDLQRVLEILKSGSIPVTGVVDHLPSDFRSHMDDLLVELRSKYNSLVDSSISCYSPAERPTTLLDVVKSSLASVLVFVYSIDFHEGVKLPRSVRPLSEEHRASPNALILLNTLEEMIQSTNRILIKQSFDWVIKSLDTAVRSASATKQPSASLSAMVSKKTKQRIGFSLDMLDPGRNLAKEIGQHKQQKRQQQIAQKLERKTTAWGKVPEAIPQPVPKAMPEPVAPSSPVLDSEPAPNTESPVVENEIYVMSVEESFKQSVNLDFFTAMINVIRSALSANASKYQALSTDYRLRGTLRMKLDQLVMSGPRRFTLLSEFVPMQVLELLQALEPEFYRLVKEAKYSDIDALAKTWSSRCAYALRRCRIEHLEIIDYYLNAKTTAMALLNDSEFPVLGDGNAQQHTKTRRNYAQALNVQSSSKFVLLDSEFPALR
ncbi:E3 ubiquitin-protein ligase HEL2 [Babesia sp. Xinjiang]|uniref:E3 ubiquitin-protein ligase HEL2 n=1 Tax=Babesia sp. Xinjiang TaxID=462227 RepID=UPI000A21CB10|nr:E3 ubiquitin-protein ligase HEL2 [Babesia sp. Xinjiang]ORM39417.1 E3 ubiquitin-protein ligase HEL2 [Babesia sp. Xinjiang]